MVSGLKVGDPGTDRFHHAGRFMAGNTGQDIHPVGPLPGAQVGMAIAGVGHLDEYFLFLGGFQFQFFNG